MSITTNFSKRTKKESEKFTKFSLSLYLRSFFNFSEVALMQQNYC